MPIVWKVTKQIHNGEDWTVVPADVIHFESRESAVRYAAAMKAGGAFKYKIVSVDIVADVDVESLIENQHHGVFASLTPEQRNAARYMFFNQVPHSP